MIMARAHSTEERRLLSLFRLGTDENPWSETPQTGPRGGTYWVHKKTGQKKYQKHRPGTKGDSKKKKPRAPKGAKSAPKKQAKRNPPPEPRGRTRSRKAIEKAVRSKSPKAMQQAAASIKSTQQAAELISQDKGVAPQKKHVMQAASEIASLGMERVARLGMAAWSGVREVFHHVLQRPINFMGSLLENLGKAFLQGSVATAGPSLVFAAFVLPVSLNAAGWVALTPLSLAVAGAALAGTGTLARLMAGRGALTGRDRFGRHDDLEVEQRLREKVVGENLSRREAERWYGTRFVDRNEDVFQNEIALMEAEWIASGKSGRGEEDKKRSAKEIGEKASVRIFGSDWVRKNAELFRQEIEKAVSQAKKMSLAYGVSW